MKNIKLVNCAFLLSLCTLADSSYATRSEGYKLYENAAKNIEAFNCTVICVKENEFNPAFSLSSTQAINIWTNQIISHDMPEGLSNLFVALNYTYQTSLTYFHVQDKTTINALLGELLNGWTLGRTPQGNYFVAIDAEQGFVLGLDKLPADGLFVQALKACIDERIENKTRTVSMNKVRRMLEAAVERNDSIRDSLNEQRDDGERLLESGSFLSASSAEDLDSVFGEPKSLENLTHEEFRLCQMPTNRQNRHSFLIGAPSSHMPEINDIRRRMRAISNTSTVFYAIGMLVKERQLLSKSTLRHLLARLLRDNQRWIRQRGTDFALGDIVPTHGIIIDGDLLRDYPQVHALFVEAANGELFSDFKIADGAEDEDDAIPKKESLRSDPQGPSVVPMCRRPSSEVPANPHQTGGLGAIQNLLVVTPEEMGQQLGPATQLERLLVMAQDLAQGMPQAVRNALAETMSLLRK